MQEFITAPASAQHAAASAVWNSVSWCDADVIAAWERLAAARAQTPFAEPYWQEAWRRFFARDEEIQLYAAQRSDGALLAAIPLLARGGVVRVAAALFNPHVPYLDLAAESLDRSLLAGLVRTLAARFDRIDLPMLRADGPFCAALHGAAREAGAYVHEWNPPGHLLLPLDSPGGYRAALSKNLLQNTERKGRKLEKEGPLTFRKIADDEALDAVYDECLEVEKASWKGDIGSAITCRPATRGFYSDVVRAAAARGQLGLYTLRLRQRLIAFELCLCHSGVIHLLKLSFLPEFSEHSPGNILRLRLLDAESACGMTCYDFGIDSEWKRRWTELVAPRTAMTLYPRTLRGQAAWWLGPRVRGLAKQLLRRT